MENERFEAILKNMKWQTKDVRNLVNKAVVDYANDRPMDAQHEMRVALNELDVLIKQTMDVNAYCL